MSDTFTIKAKKRETSQKSISKNLKNEGYVLSVLYGRGKEYSLSVERREFETVFAKAGKHSIINLDIENEGSHEVLVKNYAIDGIKRHVSHIDFYEIDRNKKIKTNVPIHAIGVPEGVKLGGGTLEVIEHEITVRAFPNAIPHQISLDVTSLKIGDSIHLQDIKFENGVEPVGDKSKPIVTVVSIEDDSKAQDAEGTAASAKEATKA